jgi:hypothetical protein
VVAEGYVRRLMRLFSSESFPIYAQSAQILIKSGRCRFLFGSDGPLQNPRNISSGAVRGVRWIRTRVLGRFGWWKPARISRATISSNLHHTKSAQDAQPQSAAPVVRRRAPSKRPNRRS